MFSEFFNQLLNCRRFLLFHWSLRVKELSCCNVYPIVKDRYLLLHIEIVLGEIPKHAFIRLPNFKQCLTIILFEVCYLPLKLGYFGGGLNFSMKALCRFIQVVIAPGVRDFSQIFASHVKVTGSILSNTASHETFEKLK